MSTQKINIGKLIDELVVEAKLIEDSSEPQHKKTKLFQGLATKFINKLYSDGRRKASNKIALSTARGYLTRARKAIAEFTGLHHRFDTEIQRLMKKYPFHHDCLSAINVVDTKTARMMKKELLDSLAAGTELAEKIDGLDFSKPKVDAQLDNLCASYPVYKQYLEALKNKDSVLSAKTTLYKVVGEIKPLHQELKQVKVDHELIVNLVMPSADKSLLSSKASSQLRTKKTSVVYVNYPKYMQEIINIIAEPAFYFDSLVSSIAPLTFALCAATGRRSIEILRTGHFEVKNKNELIFTGQAKKRSEEEQEQPLVIYTLVDANAVVNAFKTLRAYHVVCDLVGRSERETKKDHRSINDVISGKVAPHLNDFAKNFFIDKKRVFKDTRGIYGRICYQRWYLNDKRWRQKDEDIFFYELFGHSDTNAQAHYKPYKLNNYIPDFNPSPEVNARWRGLVELDDEMPSLARGDAAIKIHDFVKEAVLANKFVLINQSMLTRNTGVFRGTIQKYLALIDELAFPGESLSEQMDEDVEAESPDEVVKLAKKPLADDAVKKVDKPHIHAVQLKEGRWQVVIKKANVTKSFDLPAATKMEAMKLGYSLFVGDSFIFSVTIAFKSQPHYQDGYIIAADAKSAEQIALNDARIEGWKGEHGKIVTKKL